MAFKMAQSLLGYYPRSVLSFSLGICLFFRVYGSFFFFPFFFFFVEIVKRDVLSEALRCRNAR